MGERITFDDDRDRVLACPGCDRAGQLYERTGRNSHKGDPDDRYVCYDCGTTFDDRAELVIRQRKESPLSKSHPNSGPNPKYADITDDEFSRGNSDGD